MLLLVALLFTGCSIGPLRLIPQAPAAPEQQLPTAPKAVRELTVYDPQGILKNALKIYGEEQRVEIRQGNPKQAALMVTPYLPLAEQSKDLSDSGSLLPLAAGMSQTQGCYGVPVGSSSYGYLVDERILKALLGESFDGQNLKDASWNEWLDFVKTLDRWIESPQGQAVTLGGKKYRLPKKKTDGTQSLAGVFTVPMENSDCGTILTPILATQYRTAEQLQTTQVHKQLTQGAFKALKNTLLLEKSSLAGLAGKLFPGQESSLHSSAARQTFMQGKALFYRASTGEAAWLDEGLRQNLILIPVKFSFDPKDVGENGYSLEEILNHPVMVAESWLSIPNLASQQGEKEAQAFLLWLYTSASGKNAAPERAESAPSGLPDLSAELAQKEREQLSNQAYQQEEQQP